MQQPQMLDRLNRVEGQLNDRLTKLTDNLPEVKPARNQLAFPDYLAQAQQRAQRDPQFAEQFNAALAKYKAAGG